MRQLLFALALCGCASSPAAPHPDAAPVIAAERAFAAHAGEVGWIPAFRAYATEDASFGQPGYPNAQAQLAQTPDDGNRLLFWWPAFAGIASSGEFGFTTGPVSFDEARTPRGHYFTVWRRQADGSWKWIYDGGVGPIADANLIAPDAAEVAQLSASKGVAGSAEAAIGAVRALEERGVQAADFAADAHVFRSRHPRVIGAGAETPAGVAYGVTRVEASEAGDLVMVLGEARWPSADGGEASGLYARMWQHRAEGWRIVYDQLTLPRPAPAG